MGTRPKRQDHLSQSYLTVKKDATTILRMYEIPDMFVCDYREVYGNPSDDKTAFFELNLTQKETKLKDFKTC